MKGAERACRSRRHVRASQAGGAEYTQFHGEASYFFVILLDNHNQRSRFYFNPAEAPDRFSDQLTLGFGSLFSLLGIYYGTEQDLHRKKIKNRV